ncbi:MAG: hypothetical protein ACKOEW_10300 [Methylocystis sp.]
MTQSGENKELKAAFDEFKELMEKRVEPIFEMPPLAPTENGTKVEPKAHFDTELKVGAPTFSIPRPMSPEQAQSASGPDVSPRVGSTNSFSTTRPITAPQPAEPDTRTGGLASLQPTGGSTASPEIPESRRRKLAYLSFLIILSGLGGVGWVLSKSTPPSAAPDRAEQPAQSTPSIADTAPDSADLATDAAAQVPSTPALAPKLPESPSQSPQLQQPQDTARQAVSDPRSAPLSASPSAPAPSIAPPALQSSAPVTEPPAPTKAQTSSTQEISANPEIKPPTPAKPKPKIVKAKPKIAPQPETANARAPATSAPAAGPDTPPSPPPSPQNDGAFGFVKRTVNSITDIGRGALGGN